MSAMSTLSYTPFSLNQHFHFKTSHYPHHNVPISNYHITPTFSLKLQAPNHPINPTPQSTNTHKKSSNLLTKHGVKLLVGSVIFLGSLSPRVVLALQDKKNATLEEVRSEDDEGMYERLLKREPRNVEALKVMVNVKMKKGDTKHGVKYAERLIDIEPEQVEWRLLQALCYEMMGHFGKAKRLFRDILKENPLMLRALHGLAMAMHKSGEGDAVFDMLCDALELAYREKRVTEERNIKILIAQMHLVKGDLDEALKKYQELINENPQDFRPYLCQGIVFSLQDKKKEAEEQFEIYRNLVPEEFPQRGFLEDLVFAAKTESREQLEKEFKAEFSYKK